MGLRVSLVGVAALLWGDPAVGGDFTSDLLGYFEAGVLCAPTTSDSRTAPDTIAGQTHIVDGTPPFVSNGRVVPAILGIGFGSLAGMASDSGLEGVTISFTHPPFDGHTARKQSFQSYIGPADDPSITYYQFDHPYELALGEWVMSAAHDGEVFYRASFTVVPPAALPKLAAACGYLDLIS